MPLNSLKSYLTPHTKERIRSLLYSPYVIRDRLLCSLWGIRRLSGMRLFGIPLIQQSRRGLIQIGSNFKAVSVARHNSLGVTQRVTIKALGPVGALRIGHNVGISGATVSARSSIVIGNNVLIGSGALISDNDAHPLHPMDREDPSKTRSAPIVIEDDVFIGARSIVLKGVTIGRGSVIGAGSIVVHDVPELTIVAGNPAKVISELS